MAKDFKTTINSLDSYSRTIVQHAKNCTWASDRHAGHQQLESIAESYLDRFSHGKLTATEQANAYHVLLALKNITNYAASAQKSRVDNLAELCQRADTLRLQLKARQANATEDADTQTNYQLNTPANKGILSRIWNWGKRVIKPAAALGITAALYAGTLFGTDSQNTTTPQQAKQKHTCNKPAAPEYKHRCAAPSIPAYKHTCTAPTVPEFKEKHTCNKPVVPTYTHTCSKPETPAYQENIATARTEPSVPDGFVVKPAGVSPTIRRFLESTGKQAQPNTGKQALPYAAPPAKQADKTHPRTLENRARTASTSTPRDPDYSFRKTNDEKLHPRIAERRAAYGSQTYTASNKHDSTLTGKIKTLMDDHELNDRRQRAFERFLDDEAGFTKGYAREVADWTHGDKQRIDALKDTMDEITMLKYNWHGYVTNIINQQKTDTDKAYVAWFAQRMLVDKGAMKDDIRAYLSDIGRKHFYNAFTKSHWEARPAFNGVKDALEILLLWKLIGGIVGGNGGNGSALSITGKKAGADGVQFGGAAVGQ